MCWKVVPQTVAVRTLPMILIVLTRPPQAPAPSRLLICNCCTVPTEGHTRLMLLALIVRVQACDLITPSYGSGYAARYG
jgi:hypothetical protein